MLPPSRDYALRNKESPHLTRGYAIRCRGGLSPDRCDGVSTNIEKILGLAGVADGGLDDHAGSDGGAHLSFPWAWWPCPHISGGLRRYSRVDWIG